MGHYDHTLAGVSHNPNPFRVRAGMSTAGLLEKHGGLVSCTTTSWGAGFVWYICLPAGDRGPTLGVTRGRLIPTLVPLPQPQPARIGGCLWPLRSPWPAPSLAGACQRDIRQHAWSLPLARLACARAGGSPGRISSGAVSATQSGWD